MMQRNLMLAFVAPARARWTSAAALGLCATLLGCSDDNINMGEGLPVVEPPPLPSSSRCRDNPVLEGQIVVHNQVELDTLEGCERIAGDLYVAAFGDANLNALHALRAVSGGLTIGGTPTVQYDVTDPPGLDEAQAQEFIEAGWLSSLEGLEGLESASSLTLNGLASDGLEPLANLSTLTDGYLSLWAAPNLKNFSGLQKLTGLRTLFVSGVQQLESLDGLTLPSSMLSLSLTDVDLRQLKPLPITFISSLHLEDTQVHDLAPFASLKYVTTSLELVANQQLESLAGLENVSRIDYLQINFNRYLREVPDFEHMFALNTLWITGSPLLTRLPAFQLLQMPATFNDSNQEDFIHARPDQIKLDDLGVTAISLPASWSSAAIVEITNNPALQHVDFTGQTYIDYLSIHSNPLLEHVGTGALYKVNVLELVDNPKLSVSAFDGVRHLDMTASGNADAP